MLHFLSQINTEIENISGYFDLKNLKLHMSSHAIYFYSP